MFNDFHESTRNVGVLGALLGLFLLAGLTGLGMAVYSGMESGSNEKVSIASMIPDQLRQIESRKARIAQTEATITEFEHLTRIAEEVEDVKNEIDREQKEISKLESVKARLTAEISSLEETFNTHRNRYRVMVRTRAEGEMVDLSATKGEGYEECIITGVSPIHLQIRRPAGPEGIPFEDLPSAIRERFQFSKDEAEAYRNILKNATAVRVKKQQEWDKNQQSKQAIQAREDMAKKAAQNEMIAAQKRRDADRHKIDSEDWAQKATQYRTEAAQARATGRITSKDGLARQAEAKASKFAQSARAANDEADRLEMEAAKLRLLLAELPQNE